MRWRWGAVAVGAVLVFVGIATAAASQGNLSIAIDSEGEVTVADPDGIVENRTEEPPDRYAWRLNLTEDYHVAEIHLDQGFPVDRGRQAVPLVDDKHFVQVEDPRDVDRPARVFNLTASEGTWTYELGLLGPGEANLTLHRDLESPEIEIVSVGNVSHIGFDVTTNTSETANAELVVYNTTQDPIQDYPTPRPGPWQKFPVQGLDADTTYTFQVNASDWSGNTVQSPVREVTTAPAPNPPDPIVEPVRPEPDSTVSPDDVVVEARIDANGTQVLEQEIRLFFDKERIDRENFEVTDGTLTYHPQSALGERTYFVAVEVPNAEGGEGLARWSFDAQVKQSAPAPLTPGVLAAVLGAIAVAARRRRAS